MSDLTGKRVYVQYEAFRVDEHRYDWNVRRSEPDIPSPTVPKWDKAHVIPKRTKGRETDMSDIYNIEELVTSYGFEAESSAFSPDWAHEDYLSGMSDKDGMPVNIGNLVFWYDKSGSYEVVDINTEMGLIQVEGTKCGDLWWVAPVDVVLM